MTETTLVVDISTEHATELEQWLVRHNAKSRTWDLVLGSEGYLHITDYEQSIVHLAAFHLAERRNDLMMTPWPQLDLSQRTALLQHGADSYTYMHEGYFEDHEIADLVNQAEVLAQDVPPDSTLEPLGMIAQIREEHAINLPNWDSLAEPRRSYLCYLDRASPTWSTSRRVTESEVEPLQDGKSG